MSNVTQWFNRSRDLKRSQNKGQSFGTNKFLIGLYDVL